ncbi:UDP-N-acetylmuramoyl-L-alanyl-D-glutamate--2,6-diaminopimelate ligase [Mesobacillus zeae]|uniref:UDP-N-acetylmuramoyl-L-alanyl-D-glutamate--2,6-diaminopimelate ligase n=1 Tax=Mesobacillus zeae TaxID=1917180 RepID=A0A398BKG3_9BACI|nr:UDP-N-acetylmuramoyl-L-alanyl-D-glutamate--2,6-diaminopimelate ligase [Mesobacillus zeae]RID87906.1 UDP-N-acetylmuramoyl-L-alanyl-D-glutamate--2,6-diaminopimelate ligase [Mesobacillus zeae]
MKLHQLLGCLHPFFEYKGESPEITSIENDNRKAKEGSLFICINGYTVDGHDFAESAVQNGACAVLAERQLDLNVPVIVVKDTVRAMAVLADAFYGQPSRRLHMIGITGTNGKTTTSHLIEKIFADAGQKTGLIGTMYTKIGDTTLETRNTTPESLTLQKTFKDMVDEGVGTAVMEVSSHALVNGRVHGTDFNVAVFTNLTQDHLDYHKTMEEYKKAKGLLFSRLGNTFDCSQPKYAVLNADDPASKEYLDMTAAHVLTYGIDNEADFRAANIELTAGGTSFDLVSPFGVHKMNIQMAGRFNVYNVLAGIAAAVVSNVPLAGAIRSIESLKGVRGRFELVDEGQDFSVIVDYAHTPDSLENVLETIGQLAQEKVYVVVGCGGDRDKTKRPLMAKIACSLASDPIFTSDNPRSEDPEMILQDMETGVKGQNYTKICDRREAIFHAVKMAEKGDVILIAGKGHETYQQVGGQTFSFDDREVAIEAIRSLKGGL